MAEGARLESVFTLAGNVSSNLTLSAILPANFGYESTAPAFNPLNAIAFSLRHSPSKLWLRIYRPRLSGYTHGARATAIDLFFLVNEGWVKGRSHDEA